MKEKLKEFSKIIRSLADEKIPNDIKYHYTFNENVFILSLFEKEKIKNDETEDWLICFPTGHGILNYKPKDYDGKLSFSHCENYPITIDDIERVIKDCLEKFNK